MHPTDIRDIADKDLLITWDDGHRSLYPYRHLRFLCPCAGCVDEMSGQRTLEIKQVDQNVRALKVTDVGNYAVRFEWSDGHHTGIYAFQYLRHACPCPACSKPSGKEA